MKFEIGKTFESRDIYHLASDVIPVFPPVLEEAPLGDPPSPAIEVG